MTKYEIIFLLLIIILSIVFLWLAVSTAWLLLRKKNISKHQRFEPLKTSENQIYAAELEKIKDRQDKLDIEWAQDIMKNQIP